MSSSDRVGAAGHGQLIGTPITLALVGSRRRPGDLGGGHLAVPVHRPFTLGTLRLELIPSGRCLGAAALHVDANGRTVLYAGAVRTTDASEAAEVRSCDAVVVAAPFGERHHVFAPLDQTADQLVTWIRAELAANRTPIVVVDSALDGIEVAIRLVADEIAVSGSRSVRDAAVRLGVLATPRSSESPPERPHGRPRTDLGSAIPRVELVVPEIAAIGREPCVVIRTEAEKLRLAPGATSSTALISGRALDSHAAFDRGFAWPFAAGREQLLAWIEQTRAKEVFVTGACAEAIVTAVGRGAKILGPPHQMTLFPREAAR